MKRKRTFLTKKRRHTSVLRLLPFGEVWRLKSHLLVFSDGSRPAVRWSINGGSISPLRPSLHHHIAAVNPSSIWRAAADMWFLSSHFTAGLDSAEVALIVTAITDRWSGVSCKVQRAGRRKTGCQVLRNIWRGRVCGPHVSWDVMRMWVYWNLWKGVSVYVRGLGFV